jgi:hypothetical protein
MSNTIEKEIAKINVTSKGDGGWSPGVKKTIPVVLKAGIFPNSIEKNQDGKIDYVHSWFRAYFQTSDWDTNAIGDPYNDNGFLKSINDYLAKNGFSGKVDWSESGMQGNNFADFDCPDELLMQIFPEVFAPEETETIAPKR